MMRSLTIAETSILKLPQKLGAARLRYYPEVEMPFRDGSDIFVPYRVGWSLQLLQSGSLARISNRQSYRGLYFGGTDESPFLSLLDTDLIDTDEIQFFAGLKPDVVSKLERRWNIEAGRQGDWFYIKVPENFRSMVGMAELCALVMSIDERGRNLKEINSNRGDRLDGTRHVVDGELVEVAQGRYIARGVLRAPDHSDRKLDIYHFLAQAKGFYNREIARNAD